MSLAQAANDWFARQQHRVDCPPPADPGKRFTIYDFIPIEAGGTVALFTVIDSYSGFVLGRCFWRADPERAELPFGINIADTSARSKFHAELLAAVRSYAHEQLLRN
jgi:hypothetical protein